MLACTESPSHGIANIVPHSSVKSATSRAGLETPMTSTNACRRLARWFVARARRCCTRAFPGVSSVLVGHHVRVQIVRMRSGRRVPERSKFDRGASSSPSLARDPTRSTSAAARSRRARFAQVDGRTESRSSSTSDPDRRARTGGRPDRSQQLVSASRICDRASLQISVTVRVMLPQPMTRRTGPSAAPSLCNGRRSATLRVSSRTASAGGRARSHAGTR
jgi:hypothetical protein